MIIKCNKCLFEYETELNITNGTVYNCEKCPNSQILDNGVWIELIEEEIEELWFE